MSKKTKDYRFYLEGKEKDPIIGQLQTILQQSGNISPAQIRLLSERSGVSYHTIWAWFYGPTRNPQTITMRFVIKAAGARLGIIMEDGSIAKEPRK